LAVGRFLRGQQRGAQETEGQGDHARAPSNSWTILSHLSDPSLLIDDLTVRRECEFISLRRARLQNDERPRNPELNPFVVNCI
jgi:hypothetical protein